MGGRERCCWIDVCAGGGFGIMLGTGQKHTSMVCPWDLARRFSKCLDPFDGWTCSDDQRRGHERATTRQYRHTCEATTVFWTKKKIEIKSSMGSRDMIGVCAFCLWAQAAL